MHTMDLENSRGQQIMKAHSANDRRPPTTYYIQCRIYGTPINERSTTSSSYLSFHTSGKRKPNTEKSITIYCKSVVGKIPTTFECVLL